MEVPTIYDEAVMLKAEVKDTPPATVEAKIHDMRDDLRNLCEQLMKCARFEDAYKVLGVVMQLDALAEVDDFGLQAWPPRVDIMSPDGRRDLAPAVGS